MATRCIHFIIAITRGRQAKWVVVGLRHNRSVLLKIEAGWLLVSARLGMFYRNRKFVIMKMKCQEASLKLIGAKDYKLTWTYQGQYVTSRSCLQSEKVSRSKWWSLIIFDAYSRYSAMLGLEGLFSHEMTTTETMFRCAFPWQCDWI